MSLRRASAVPPPLDREAEIASTGSVKSAAFRPRLAQLLPLVIAVVGVAGVAGVVGCRSGQYDKNVRLYLDSPQSQAAGSMSRGGWYVVGARTPDASFHELGIRFPAEEGEKLELRREGEAILACAAGIWVPVEDIPPDAVYVAWARQNYSSRRAGEGGSGPRVGFSLSLIMRGLIESAWEELMDDDEDHDKPRRRKAKPDKEEDRGKRYERSDGDGRERTRDD